MTCPWMTRIEAQAFPDHQALAGAVAETLGSKRLVLITGAEPDGARLRARYDAIFERLGSVQNIGEDFTKGGLQTGERWLEIRYDADIPDMAAFRHSKNAQPWHTDESYIGDPCDVMGMYCIQAAPAGGATNFIAVEDVYDVVAEEDPALLEQLLTVPLCYSKATQSRTRPILERDQAGVLTINFNYFCLDGDAPEAHRHINERFFELVNRRLRTHPNTFSVVLQPGDAVLWWDHYLLHGRDAFTATKTNDRFIYKTGIQVPGPRPRGLAA